MEGAFDFGDELFGATTEDEGAGFGLWAVGEEVEAFGADLAFFEEAARAKVRRVDVGAGGLGGGAGGLTDTFEVVGGDTARAEDVSIGKILGGEVANGELGEDDFSAGLMKSFHFVVDDLPFGIDDGLIFGNLINSDLGVVFLCFEFEFDVEADDFRVLERLGLLLETGVGEGFFEGYTIDEEGVL